MPDVVSYLSIRYTYYYYNKDTFKVPLGYNTVPLDYTESFYESA